MQRKYYIKKIIQSGNMVERYTYERPVSVRRSTHPNYIKPVGRAKKATDDKGKKQNREASLRRAKKTV